MTKDTYFSCLSQGLMHLYNDRFLVDATIHAADGNVGIHKIILIAFSDHFQQIAKKGENISEIDASGYKKNDIIQLVNFLYGSSHQVNAEATELIKHLNLNLTVDEEISKKKIAKGESNKNLIELELKLMRNLIFQITISKLGQNPRICTDVTIKTGRNIHQCHKIVLASMSKYFEAMFASGMTESQDAVTIDLEGVDTNTFILILNYLYTGKIQPSTSNAQELLSTAVYLQILALQEEMELFFLGQLDCTNCVDIWQLGDIYSCQLLVKGSWTFVLDHFQRIPKLKLVSGLKVHDIERLCLDENLQVNEETLVLQLILDWLSANSVYIGEKEARSLLSCVRFGLIEENYLQDMLKHKNIELSNQMIKTIMEELILKDSFIKNYKARKEKTFVVIKRSSYTTGIDVACYSLCQKKWFELSGMPQCSGGTGFASCVGNGSLFVTGGTATPKNSFCFDFAGNQWSELPEMTEGRSSHGVAYVTGCLYVFGGSELSSGAFNIVSSIEKYDPASQTWTTEGEMEIPTYDSAYAAVKSCIYIFGGSMGLLSGVYIKEIQCFDTTTATCSVLDHHLPFTLSLAVACCNGRDIYITCPNGKMLHYNEDSSPAVISEADGSQLMGYATLYHNQSVYKVGGYSVVGESDSIQRFDLRQNKELPFSDTKLPFKKETNQLFGTVDYISHALLGKECPKRNVKRKVTLGRRK